MKELKFRAWDRVKRKMLYDVSPFNIHIKENEPLLSMEYSNHDDCEFEQYTGLKDKNGKEIYEGDIVHVANHGRTPYVVTYREWDCSFICKNENLVDFVHMFKTMPQCYEVIGNIHENPELMEKEKE